LGAYVRLTAAGLGCPDWPGCYGHVTPLGASRAERLNGISEQAARCWQGLARMIHRYAGARSVHHRVIAALAITSRRARLMKHRYAIALLATVVCKHSGMLTVTWQLKR